jgi:hypothetical protein
MPTKTTRGARYATAVRSAYDLNESQQVLVDEIAATIDVIDRLPAAKVAEARQQRILLGRLLGQLALPDVGALDRATVTTIKATKAARARWSKGAS